MPRSQVLQQRTSRFLHAVVLALLVVPTALGQYQPEIVSSQDSWPLYRGDSFGTGRATSSLPDKLDVVWRYEVENGAFTSTPVISEGKVYIGDLDGHVICLRLASGEELWKQKVESGFVGSPAIQNGLVYLGDYDGKFYCFDAENGETKWTHSSLAEISAGANFYQGKVIFASQDASIYCLDAVKGDLVWKHTLQDQIQSYPTIVDGKCFVAGCDQMLHIVDIDTGQDVSQVEIGAPTGVTPAVVKDHVIFGTEAGEVMAVNWKDGKISWRYQDGRRSHPIRSCPAVTDKMVVIGSRSKRVYGLDIATGEEKWIFPTRRRVDSAPVVVGERVFFGAGDGRLYMLDLQTGKKQWEYEAGSSFVGSPAVANDRLVIANENGVVYAFGAK